MTQGLSTMEPAEVGYGYSYTEGVLILAKEKGAY